MKTKSILLTALFALAACSTTDEQEVETAIRESLSQRGTVLRVDVVRRDEDHMTGLAIIRNHAGTEVRMNCEAERQGGGSMMTQGFTLRCRPAGANAQAGPVPGAEGKGP